VSSVDYTTKAFSLNRADNAILGTPGNAKIQVGML